MSVLPEELGTLVQKCGPRRPGGRPGVGPARVRHSHTHHRARFPVAAAASASASPASASLPGIYTHSDLRAVSILDDVSPQTANRRRALVRTMGGSEPMSGPRELAVANRRRAGWRVMLQSGESEEAASGSRSHSHCSTLSSIETAPGQVRAGRALGDSVLAEEK